MLPLLHAFAAPEKAVHGLLFPTEVFEAGLDSVGLEAPHITVEYLEKYASDLRALALA